MNAIQDQMELAADLILDACTFLEIDYNKLMNEYFQPVAMDQRFGTTINIHSSKKSNGKVTAYFNHKYAVKSNGTEFDYFVITLRSFRHGEIQEVISTYDFANQIASKEQTPLNAFQQKQAEKKRQEQMIRLEQIKKDQAEEEAKKAAKNKNIYMKSVEELNLPQSTEEFYWDEKGIKYDTVEHRTIDGKQGLYHGIKAYDGKTSEFVGIQRIFKEGGKKFTAGSKQSNVYHTVGFTKGCTPAIACEGIATAASISEAFRDEPVMSVFSLGNLKNLSRYDESLLKGIKYIAADNDNKVDDYGLRKPNYGVLGALEAGWRNNLPVAIPSCDGDFNDMIMQGFEYSDIVRCFHDDHVIEVKKLAVQSLPFVGEWPNEGDSSYPARTRLITKMVQNAASSLSLKAENWAEGEIMNQIVEILGYEIPDMEKICKKAVASRIKTLSMGYKIDKATLESAEVDFEIVKNLDEVASKIDQRKGEVAILIAPMGAGKTQKVMIPLGKTFEKQTIVSPLVSLCAELAKRSDTHLYSTYEGGKNSDIKNGITTTINSLIKKANQEFIKDGCLIVDEFTQVLSSICSGTVKGHEKAATMSTLSEMIDKSKISLLADANTTIDHINQIKVIAKKLNRRLKVYFMDYQNESYNVEIVGAGGSMHALQVAIHDGERVVFGADSVEHCKRAEALCKAMGVKSQIIYQDNKGDLSNEELMKGADDYLSENEVQVFIYSPTVKSGLSIEKTQFDRFIGYFSCALPFTDFQQMMHRARMVRKFTIETSSSNRSNEVRGVEKLIEGDRALFSRAGGDVESEEYQSQMKSIEEICGFTAIDLKAKAYGTARLCAWLYSTGYNVKFGFIKNELGKALQKEMKVEVSEREAIDTMKAETISEARMIKLSEKNDNKNMTYENSLSIVKYKCDLYFGLSDEMKSLSKENKGSMDHVKSIVKSVREGIESKLYRYKVATNNAEVIHASEELKTGMDVNKALVFEDIGKIFFGNIELDENMSVMLTSDEMNKFAAKFKGEEISSLMSAIGFKPYSDYGVKKGQMILNLAEAMGAKKSVKTLRTNGKANRYTVLDFSMIHGAYLREKQYEESKAEIREEMAEMAEFSFAKLNQDKEDARFTGIQCGRINDIEFGEEFLQFKVTVRGMVGVITVKEKIGNMMQLLDSINPVAAMRKPKTESEFKRAFNTTAPKVNIKDGVVRCLHLAPQFEYTTRSGKKKVTR